MRDRRNAASAKNVWLAACEFVNEVWRARRRGLRFSPKMQHALGEAEGAALFWAHAAFAEVYPAKARAYERLNRGKPVIRNRRDLNRLLAAKKKPAAA